MTDVQSLPHMTGKTISRIRRVHYVAPDTTNESSGPVEITFDEDRTILLLDAGSDGATLWFSSEPWEDPFREPLSDENREFVARSGKWTAFDVSTEPGYDALVGTAVQEVCELRASSGILSGMVIVAESGVLRAKVDADELFVDVFHKSNRR
jgi:hypothetical protein